MSWRTVIITTQSKLDYKMGYMVVRGKETHRIFLDEIAILLIENPMVSLTGCLVTALIEKKIRIVFSENSAFEPVIANLILTFGEPVNILKADTKNVGGVAKGEMILEFMEGSTRTEMMKQYLKEKGLAIGEVTEYVGS